MDRAITLEKIENARARMTQAACIAKGDYGAKELSVDEQRWISEMLKSAASEISAMLEAPRG